MRAMTNEQAWGACREAYALGDSLRHAASRLGLNYEAVKKRAQRQRWPSPAMLTKATPKPCLSGAEIAAETWAARGELHRLTVWELVASALRSAAPARLESWADIERAARLGDKATGLERTAPVVALNFPCGGDAGFIDLA